MTHDQRLRRYVWFLMTFTAGLWLFTGAAFAQTELRAGNIFGKVTDNGGAALPGVTVTLTGIGAPQTFISDNEGNYRFLNLSPGRYTIVAELSGMGKVQRAAEVIVGANTEANLKISPSVSESITVTAATPVIDRREVTTGANIEAVELAKVPSARDPWVILQSVPGVQVDRVNVGGNKSGQQSYFVGKGVERNQTTWNLDGVPSSDMQATGTSAFYYDFESFQEMHVSTGSADPSVQTPGVQINMVTKRGTNEFKGSARYLLTDKSFQDDPRVPSEGALYGLKSVNSINKIDDYGFEAGGPIMADRMWLWAAASQNKINTIVPGSSSQYQKFDLKYYNAKFNAQFAPNNEGNIYWMYNDKTEQHRGCCSNRAVESSTNQSGPGFVVKLEDTHTFSSNLYLTGKVSHIKNGYTLDPVGGRNTNVYYTDDGSFANGSTTYFSQRVPQDAAHVDGSRFFNIGSTNHELKFGFGYRSTPVESITSWPGDGTFVDFYDDPTSNDVAITRDAIPKYGSNYADLFVGDTIAMGNLTVTGGLRYDRSSAKNKASSVPANPAFPDILPAASFPGDKRALVWKGISPRVGATYALGSDKRTIVRGSYSRYMDQLGSGQVGPNNPFYVVQMIYYYWQDLNNDKRAQRNEIDFASGVELAKHVDPLNPSSPVSTGRIDYGMKAPKTDEFIVGLEREIMPAFAVAANYTYRKRSDFVWNQYEKHQGVGDFYTSADFVPVATPVTGTLPNGKAYSVSYYRLKPGVAAPVYSVATNRPDYYQTYQDVELTATKRMANHWMMRGSVTLSDWKQHVGANGVVDPSPVLNVFGVGASSSNSCYGCVGTTAVASAGGEDGYINSRWNVALNGVYEFPYQISLGTAFNAREGYIVPYYRRINSRDGLGNRRILVNGFDGAGNRLDNLYDLDFSLTKTFHVRNGVGLELSATLFNALNQNTALWRDNRLYTATGTDLAAGNNNIQELMSPRVWRFGARVTF